MIGSFFWVYSVGLVLSQDGKSRRSISLTADFALGGFQDSCILVPAFTPTSWLAQTQNQAHSPLDPANPITLCPRPVVKQPEPPPPQKKKSNKKEAPQDRSKGPEWSRRRPGLR